MTNKTKISDRAIRSMPYQSRLKAYEREKDQLFERIAGMSAREVQEAHDALIRKWKI